MRHFDNLLIFVTILLTSVYSAANPNMATAGLLAARNRCPANYILIQKLAGYTTQDFCVAKYEMKKVNTKAVSQASGSPWNSIARGATAMTVGSAWKACKDLGAKYDLISNNEWQTIARNIEGVATNWSGNSVGSGRLNQGHSDGSPYIALAAGSDSDPCHETEQACTKQSWDKQKRTHFLSNGAVIWDFAGNVWEWIRDINNISYASSAYIYELSGPEKNRFGPQRDYSNAISNDYGLGQGEFTNKDGAVTRGGSYHAKGGLFSTLLNYSYKESSFGDFGFRCVYYP